MSSDRSLCCIVGIGETEYTRNSERTTRQMAVQALCAASADAGIQPVDIDGMLSYHSNDSTTCQAVAQDLGLQLDFHMDVLGGGTSTEALVGLASGAIAQGMCNTVAIFRSMNGYSGSRMGQSPTPESSGKRRIAGPALESQPFGLIGAAQTLQLTFTRHMYEFGTTSEQLAHVRVAQSHHASSNPKALKKARVTVEEVLDSRWIAKPSCHLLDCCLESDNATCLIVTSQDRARDMRQVPVHVLSVAGRTNREFPESYFHYNQLTRTAGYLARDRVFQQAGVSQADVDVLGCYDAFTFIPVLLLEAYGFCDEGAGGTYVSSGAIELGGASPINTSGGQLCEGYSHGMNLVIENVRQLRHAADDFCEAGGGGTHTYLYGDAGCRQVRSAEIAMNLAFGTPAFTSAMILSR